MAQGLTLCRCSGNVRGINKEQLNLPSSESFVSPSLLLPTLRQGWTLVVVVGAVEPSSEMCSFFFFAEATPLHEGFPGPLH